MRRGWVRYLAAGSGLAVLAYGAPAPVAAEGNAGLHVHKTVDPLQVTLTPGIGVTLGVDKAAAIPGDTLKYTAVVTNPTATFAMGGDINAEAVASTDSNVAYYWDELQYCAQGCGTGAADPHWTSLATFEAGQTGYQPITPPSVHTGMSLAATSVTRSGVTYPTSGDPILGTEISPSATAAWTYRSTIVLTPPQVALLGDPAQANVIRNVLHFEVTSRNTTAAQPYTDPEPFTNPFISVSNPGAISGVTVKFTLPDGTTTAVPGPSTLSPGGSASVSATFRVPVPAPRGPDETEARYVTRLLAIDGSSLSATAVASGSGFSGPVYATSPAVFTEENLPIVTIAKSGPSVVNAGDTETNPLSLQNAGGAAAASLVVVDSVPSGGSGTVSGTPASLAPGATASASAAYAVPVGQGAGDLTDTASVTWLDGNGNPYGSLSSSFTTQVHNVLFGARLTLAPTSAGPNAPGSTQTLTAALVDSHGSPIAGQVVHFTVTGANATSGTGTTDAGGKASFSYTGANTGNDVAQASVTAPGINITSNTSAISWLKVLQPVVTTEVQGNFFANPANSCTFDVGPNSSPVFTQSFPDILFNPSASAVPHDISTVTNFTRPFTDLTVDVNGNYNGQVVAQGNGQQAGLGSLINFYGVFTGNFVINQPGDLTFRILHDDGYIIGVGNGATRVSGDLEGNPPATTPFNQYGVVAAWNTGSSGSSSSGPATVHFPAAGTYPYELDYTECGAGSLFLNLLTEQFIAQTSPLSIYVGYADALRPGGSAFPFPWNGSPNTIFAGCTCSYDAGAIRFDNNSPDPMTFNSITVDIGTNHFDLWPHGITLPPGQILVITETLDDNFDTSDLTGSPCFVNNGVIPQINVTMAGTTTTYPDNNQVLNTTGFDQACIHSETHPWQNIAGSATAINLPLPPAVSLNLTPFNVPAAIQGQSLALTVSALDGAGNPVANLPVAIQVNGANSQTLNGTTDLAGLVTLSYSGAFAGADTVEASAFIGGLRSTSNVGSVIWISPGGNSSPLAPSISNPTPADGSIITKPVAVDASVAPPSGHSITAWKVFYQALSGGPVVVIGGGTGAPPSPLGITFDPTLVADGAYRLTVEATADNGAVQDVSSGIGVYGGLKLGRYTTTFQDMSAVVAGFQMEVRRTYDSTDMSNGDFGAGWRVDLSNFRTSSNRVLGVAGWTQYNKSCTLGLCFTAFKNSAPRFVTVVFPDQHSEVFDFTPAGGTNVFWSCTPGFTARASLGSTSTLLPLDDTSCSYTGDGNIYGANGAYNPQRFQLTTRTGQVLVLDAKQGLVSMTDKDGNRLSVDASGIHASSGESITFTRDASGRITDVTGPLAAQHLHYTYFGSAGPNELKSVVDPTGKTYAYTYTAGGLLTSEVGPDGKPVVTVSYDSAGRAVSLAYGSQPALSVTNDVSSQQQLVLDPNAGLTTVYTYDNLGDVVERDQVFGGTIRKTMYEYDAVGRRTLLVDDLGRPWKWTYDASGDILSYSDGAGRMWQFQNYNALGEFGTMLAPDGSVLYTQTYDSAGRALTKQKPGQNPTTYTYYPNGLIQSETDPGGRTVNFTYDSAGHLTSQSDSMGRVTSYTPDAAGQVTAVQDPAGHMNQMVYDGLGQLTQLTDANHQSWLYFRDAYDRLQRTQDPVGNSINYSYDDTGRMSRVVDRNGAATSYTYDVDGRLIQESRPNNDILSFTYDALGQMVAAADSSAHDDFTYDGVGNLASQVSCGPTATPTTPCATTPTQPLVTLAYGYNGSNQLSAITGPDGVTSYGYDSSGRLAQITDPSHGTFGFTFDSLGQVSALSRPNGVNDTLTLDASGDLLSRDSSVGTTQISTSHFSVDLATGRTLQMTDQTGSNTYNYLDDGQLNSAVHPAASGLAPENFTYDPAGNRTSWTGSPSGSVTYDAADRLLSDGTNLYTYDAEGNLTAKSPRADPGATTTYDWNSDHQLLAVHFPNGTTTTYRYDALGRRVEAAGPNGTTRFVWDTYGDIHAEYDAANQVVASYVQSLVQDEPLEVTEGGASYYYVPDGHGNIRALTDRSGAVVDSYVYDSFGQQIASGTVHNPFTYRAREYDAASGLYYNRARYYDPATGRFISEDPLSRPAPYVYADNNPVSLDDPSGKITAETSLIYAADTEQSIAVIGEEQMVLTATVGVAAPLVVGEASIGAEEVLLDALIYGPLLFRLVALVVAFGYETKQLCDFLNSVPSAPSPTTTCPSAPVATVSTPQGPKCGPLELPDPGGDGTKPVVGPGK